MLDRMADKLAHRGPDGEGRYLRGAVGLAHRRLAILDVAAGAQPMVDDSDRVAISYNGEIYNFRQLRRELEGDGWTFRTHCDTEVILVGYLAWGLSVVDRLRGMFAFALWDGRSETCHLARDPLGIKPLYFSLDEGRLLFASELPALLEAWNGPRVLSMTALEDYLALGYVPDPDCLVAGVEKLPPGSMISVPVRGAARRQQHWAPAVAPPDPNARPDDARPDAGTLLDRLSASVKRRLIADVPLGAFLSGGLDSSTIVGLMTRLNGPGVKTCVIASDDPAHDEAAAAQEVATHFAADHQARTATATDGALLDLIPALYGEPLADISALPTFRVSQLARERVTVALSGDGADELFLGYRRYRMHGMEERLRRWLPRWLQKGVIAPLARLMPKLDRAPRWLRPKATLEGLARTSAQAYFNSVARGPDRDRLPLYSRDARDRLGDYRAVHRFERLDREAASLPPLARARHIDLKTWLPGDILTKVDRASMACGLEVRVPFLDRDFVDWALTLPTDGMIAKGQGKWPLRRAIRGFVPHSVLDRPKKGFDVPLGQWLRGAMAPALDSLLSEEGWLASSGLFDPGRVADLVRAHKAGHGDHGQILWSLLVLDRCAKALDIRVDPGVTDQTGP